MANEKRLIDANARIEEIRKAHCTNCENYGGVKCRACWVDDAIGLIDDAPTVDAVEVVRCKDCKHLEIDPGLRYDKRMCLMRGGEYGYCKDDDFCSYGERREGE